MPSQCRANAEWSVKELRAERLDLLRQAVGDTPFILCIDETGDRKNGHTTDYSVATDSVATDSVATQSVHR